MRGLRSNYIQVDEIWCYVAMKQKEANKRFYNNPEVGDQYTFVAMDAETKLVPYYSVGKRTGLAALDFMKELSNRITGRFQLSTDAFAPYYEVVDEVFGANVDYGQIHKQYGEERQEQKRYSPANIIRITKNPLIGEPAPKHICTSHIERQNLTMRMNMRRFTRLTNAFSKKVDNLKAAVALHFFHYNFIRIHKSLRVTPAMQAGIASTVWTWEMFFGFEVEIRRVA